MDKVCFKREYLGKWAELDESSCNALKEYDSTVDYIAISPHKHMQKVADKYSTTIEEMKKHWKCIPREQMEQHKRRH